MSSPVVSTSLFLARFDGSLLADISGYFLSAVVSMDTDREMTWTMDAEVTWDGWQALRPYRDWIAPVLTVGYPDGTVRRGQLGLYLVLDSPETHEELDSTVGLECGDPMWLFSRQGVGGLFKVMGRTRKTRVVKQLIDSAVLTEDQQGRPRYAIPDDAEETKRDREWPKDTPKLEIANQMLRGAGFYELYTTKHGILTTKRRGNNKLRDRTPVRAYAANVPAGIVLPRQYAPIGGVPSEVYDAVQTSPRSSDLTTDVLLVNDDPQGGRMYVERKITAGMRSRRNVLRDQGRKKTKKRQGRNHRVEVEDDASAAEVAEALADELGTLNTRLSLTVMADPVPEFAHETIACALYRVDGQDVAVGHYKVFSVRYGLTPTDAVMEIEAGRIDDAHDAFDDVDGRKKDRERRNRDRNGPFRGRG